MKKIGALILMFGFIVAITGCATFVNTKDANPDQGYEKIGSISYSTITWSWTNFSELGNSNFNNKLYDKLYVKAVKKYGNEIDLRNIVIKDSLWTNIGIHLGAAIGGTVVAQITNPQDQLSSSSSPQNSAYGLIYLLTLAKFVNISADVIKVDDVDNITRGDFYKFGTTPLTEREKEAVSNHTIFIGMSERALILSWGKPKRINESNYGYGTEKQYCYDNQYVYVKRGVITAWN